jgi:hypothetical protein
MDNLQYIRDAIRQHGNRTQVKVIRWEINPVTGAQDTPYEVSVNAQIALRELQKPINKRSYSWARIRPIGETHVGIKHKAEVAVLPDIEKLKEELKAQLRAEMQAELAAATTSTEDEEEEKPKRKRKATIVIDQDEPTGLDSPDLRVDELPL